jgi:nitrite reductase/ring-hydroxylating ferredoxin subunit
MGAVRLPLSADPTQDHVDLTVEDGPPIIACPWHHYEFNLETGHELRGGRRAITYRIEVADGRVLVKPARAAG